MEENQPDGQSYILLAMKHIPPGIVCTGFYLIGVRQGQASDIFTLANPVKVFEVPQQNGSTGFNFVADFLLTQTENLRVPASSVAYYRLLDDVVDERIIQNVLGAVARSRMQQAGLVSPDEAVPAPRGVPPKEFARRS